jgi:hypothetical protein
MEQNAAIQASYEPTSKNPLAFFNYFFVKSGLKIFRDDFFNFEEHGFSEVVEWNLEEEYIIFRAFDNDKEEEYTYEVKFSEVLHRMLLRKYYLAIDKIEEGVREHTEETSIRVFLNKLLAETKYILEILNTSRDASKYLLCRNSVEAIIKFIFKRFSTFVDSLQVELFLESILPKERPLLLTGGSLVKNNLGIYGFSWTANPIGRSRILYQGLIENGFISNEVDLKTFKKAFEGDLLINPLKIRWIKTLKGKLSKPMILHLIFELEAKNLIENNESKTLIFKMISRIFVDHKGQELKHLEVSDSTVNKNRLNPTEPEIVLSQIIESLH